MRPGFPRRRPLTALQVEVTSRCTRRCDVCPRTALASVWCEGDLSDTTWEVLRNDLGMARHVHLQGWGEPLLHPRLPEMVDAVKTAGSTVGLTTNGDLLAGAAGWIVARRVDLVTVSVAGDEATHATLRSGSRLEEVWAAVEQLVACRGRRRKPKIQVSYLLTDRNAGEMPAVVRAAAEVGIDEVFVTHLDCTPSRKLLEAAAFGASGLRPGAADAVAAAARAARTIGIAFRAPALAREELLVCALDPLRVVFVGWDGRVGPCVNLVLPVSGQIPRWTRDGSTSVEPVVFGRLEEASLREILHGARYRRFTGPFESRLAIERQFVSSVASRYGADALERLDKADRLRSEGLDASPFPERCAGCHKASGW